MKPIILAIALFGAGYASSSLVKPALTEIIDMRSAIDLGIVPTTMLRVDAESVLMVARSPSGKARVILSDEEGHVICAPNN